MCKAFTRVNSIHTDLMPRNAHTSQDSNNGSNCANVCYTLFYAKLGRELLFLSKKPAFEIVNTRMISMTFRIVLFGALDCVFSLHLSLRHKLQWDLVPW